MKVATRFDAIEAVASYIASTALPVAAPNSLRDEVRCSWTKALSADDAFDPDFTLVSQAAARGSRLWAVHRSTGLVFSGMSFPADLSWLEQARTAVEATAL